MFPSFPQPPLHPLCFPLRPSGFCDLVRHLTLVPVLSAGDSVHTHTCCYCCPPLGPTRDLDCRFLTLQLSPLTRSHTSDLLVFSIKSPRLSYSVTDRRKQSNTERVMVLLQTLERREYPRAPSSPSYKEETEDAGRELIYGKQARKKVSDGDLSTSGQASGHQQRLTLCLG